MLCGPCQGRSEPGTFIQQGGRADHQHKTPYNDGAMHVIFESLNFMTHIGCSTLRVTLVVKIGLSADLSLKRIMD
jgi:hypothetical protein